MAETAQPLAHRAVVLLLAVLLGGCALTGRSFGRYVDDKTLTGSVKVSLAAVHLSHLKRVNVDVYDGVVYLSGVVGSPIEKSDAEIAAWRADGVEQVVNDLVVRGEDTGIAALPQFRRRHALMDRYVWVTRVEPRSAGGPDLAYDADGAVVATVYTLSSRALLNTAVTTLPSDGRRIDRVSIYGIPVREDVPEPQYAVVLWHVTGRPGLE